MPEQRLSKEAVKVWIMKGAIMELLGFSTLGILFYLDYLFGWKDWIGWILIGITIISVVMAVWALFIEPFLLYKNWRYEVSEQFLQLKFGAINEAHHLVPMTKIQSVATNQGPFLRKYGLSSLTIQTMASSHSIPALPEETAQQLRNNIAQFAQIKEVDE
ncbi:PH domain-containing protein [Salibacterium salarium]